MNGMCLQPVSLPQDADDATDNMLFRDNITWSKGRLRRAKAMSAILGNKQPSRKKIFSEVRVSEDIVIWHIDVHGKTIRCAKVQNPVVLTKPESDAWRQLAGVQRLEIEDPEATQSTIPKQIVTELRSLESLSITWTKIKSVPSSLFRLPLNSLYLQRNQIKTINGIEKASMLTILDISNNCLNSLPRTFGMLQSLVDLNLSGNGLHELPDSVGSLSQLKKLDCSCNKLRSLPNSIGYMIELTSLDVSANQLTSLPESIGSLAKLEDLRVRSNQMTGLPDSFGQLNRLGSLLLRNNKLADVPEQLSRLTGLQSLNLRENMITHMDRPIGSLKYLILDQNQLQQIDVGILQCANLQYLSLKSNAIVEVTGTIGRLANIRSLNLSDNAITDVPVELDRLTQLRHLSLCSTKIRTVPLGVARMPTLKTLELNDCKELDRYLGIAYKDNGLPGVVHYLQRNEETSTEVTSTEVASTEVGSDEKPVVRRTESTRQTAEAKNVQSLYPLDNSPHDAVSRNPGGDNPPVEIRNVAGLSIMPGTSVERPAEEATPQVEAGRSAPAQLVHVARQSLVPADKRPAKPSKPRKPTDLASRRPNQSRLDESTGGGTDSGGAECQLETIAESPGSDVVSTTPEFGDLTSSSAAETTQNQQRDQSGEDVDQAAVHPGTADRAAHEDPPAAAARGAKPRPPVKKRPSKTAT